MDLLITRKQLEKDTGLSRQAIHNRIARGSFKTVIAPMEIEMEAIVMDKKIYDALVNKNRLQK